MVSYFFRYSNLDIKNIIFDCLGCFSVPTSETISCSKKSHWPISSSGKKSESISITNLRSVGKTKQLRIFLYLFEYIFCVFFKISKKFCLIFTKSFCIRFSNEQVSYFWRGMRLTKGIDKEKFILFNIYDIIFISLKKKKKKFFPI